MTFTIDGKPIDGIAMAPEWVREKLTPETIQYAEEFGKWLAGKGHNPLRKGETLTTTQLAGALILLVSILLVKYERNLPKFVDWWQIIWRWRLRNK